MIVCSCNVLSDYEVRTAVSVAMHRTPSHVYGCLGCRVQCGRCAHTIRKIMDEVPDSVEIGCPPGNAGHAAPPDQQL
jgi:bacterioferritin-associated ferredoxin